MRRPFPFDPRADSNTPPAPRPPWALPAVDEAASAQVNLGSHCWLLYDPKTDAWSDGSGSLPAVTAKPPRALDPLQFRESDLSSAVENLSVGEIPSDHGFANYPVPA